jgi:hypothetical protein
MVLNGFLNSLKHLIDIRHRKTGDMTPPPLSARTSGSFGKANSRIKIPAGMQIRHRLQQ